MITRVNISEAERTVIESLWDKGPLTAEQVAGEVAPEKSWTLVTVKTLLGRLRKKKAIVARREGRRFVYTAKLTRDDYLSTESRHFVDRLFDGRVAPLVSHFTETKQLTKRDIEELKRMLDKMS